MKSALLSKLLLLLTALLLICLSIDPSYGQNDPTREIMVYFSRGVKRTPAKGPAQISSTAIQRVLARFNISQKQVTAAFPNFNPADTLKKTPKGRLIKQANMANIYKILVPAGEKRQQVIDSLKNLPNVLFAEPNGRSISQVVLPNDPHFDNPTNPGTGGDQWNLLNTGQNGGTAGADIDAPEAWEITEGSASTKIGIIDTGVLSSHEDLSGKVTGDAQSSNHGTHVAGIAAAKTDNSKGVAGIDWNAQIINQVWGDDPQTVNAIMDAVNSGAQIINNSYIECNNCNNPVPDPRYSTTVRIAFANAYKMNVVAAAAMGNFNTSTVYYPAGFGQGIIAVGATNRNDTRWVWNSTQGSNTGSDIDVVAPGEDILSTWGNGGYALDTGTSMATPHISGIAGLMLAYEPSLYNDDIEH